MSDNLVERVSKLEVGLMETRRVVDGHIVECIATRREIREAIEELRATILKWAGVFIAVGFILQFVFAWLAPVIVYKMFNL